MNSNLSRVCGPLDHGSLSKLLCYCGAAGEAGSCLQSCEREVAGENKRRGTRRLMIGLQYA